MGSRLEVGWNWLRSVVLGALYRIHHKELWDFGNLHMQNENRYDFVATCSVIVNAKFH
jgi:hypothetical protein